MQRVGLAVAILLVGLWMLSSLRPKSQPSQPVTPDKPVHPAQPRADLTAADLAAFNDGQQLFTQVLPTLGPQYNGKTCASCHAITTAGGSGDLQHPCYIGPGTEMEIELYRTYALPGWSVPDRPAGIGLRIAPPLYGLGLVEQIPDATILAACGQGHATRAKDLGSLPRNRIARFGYKPILGTVVDFVGGELLAQHLVTNTLEGTSDKYGVDDDEFPDPEVHRDFAERIAAFVRGLAPPQREPTDAEGEAAFHAFGCATCHVPDMPPAMNVFSDFCVHSMGPALADGIVDRTAQGDEFRTAPLWGLRSRTLYLHDGRATSVDAAIKAHGGEGQHAADAYQNAAPARQAALLRFLGTL